eukprot:TRINITY_DN74374_c0_g1_i1.p1 TRINITY_DN74374_c0_g1~~TRINITY_DN74374_c0_g1_i1.p1  ORF type:complete len:191 (+),score=32.27 TRINITY_DN74374_c0_g1_i1:37-573(+)
MASSAPAASGQVAVSHALMHGSIADLGSRHAQQGRRRVVSFGQSSFMDGELSCKRNDSKEETGLAVSCYDSTTSTAASSDSGSPCVADGSNEFNGNRAAEDEAKETDSCSGADGRRSSRRPSMCDDLETLLDAYSKHELAVTQRRSLHPRSGLAITFSDDITKSTLLQARRHARIQSV